MHGGIINGISGTPPPINQIQHQLQQQQQQILLQQSQQNGGMNGIGGPHHIQEYNGSIPITHHMTHREREVNFSP
jgi:hypothetical protein